MADVNVSINGRIYEIGCDSGQEGRVAELAAHIDQRLQQISRSGAAYNDAHLMVLTALVLADELYEAREGHGSRPVVKGAQHAVSAPVSGHAVASQPVVNAPQPAVHAAQPAPSKEEEAAMLRVLDQLTKRIDGIAQRLQAA